MQCFCKTVVAYGLLCDKIDIGILESPFPGEQLEDPWWIRWRKNTVTSKLLKKMHIVNDCRITNVLVLWSCLLGFGRASPPHCENPYIYIFLIRLAI